MTIEQVALALEEGLFLATQRKLTVEHIYWFSSVFSLPPDMVNFGMHRYQISISDTDSDTSLSVSADTEYWSDTADTEYRSDTFPKIC